MDNIIPFGEGTTEIIVKVHNPICGIRSKSMAVSSSMMSMMMREREREGEREREREREWGNGERGRMGFFFKWHCLETFVSIVCDQFMCLVLERHQ